MYVTHNYPHEMAEDVFHDRLEETAIQALGRRLGQLAKRGIRGADAQRDPKVKEHALRAYDREVR